MHTAAFHGDFARPSDLAADAGHPFWIDSYPSYDRDVGQLDSLVRQLRQHRDLVLIGYSRGGDMVAYLSTILTNIVAAVVYESPVQSVRRTGGTFPVLQIWNLHSRRRQTRAAKEAYAAWLGPSPHRQVDIFFGIGRHTRPVMRPRTLFRGHGWDTRLNPAIYQWITDNVPVTFPAPSVEPASEIIVYSTLHHAPAKDLT